MFEDRNEGQRWLDSIVLIPQLSPTTLLQWSAIQVEYAQIEGTMSKFNRQLLLMDSLLALPEMQGLPRDAWFRKYQKQAWGDYNKRLGNYDKALELFSTLLAQLEQEKPPSIESQQLQFNVHQQLAVIYLTEGNAREAIIHYRHSLDNYRSYGNNSIGYVNALYKIGDIYLQQQDMEQASIHYQLAIDSLEKAILLAEPGKWSDYAFNAYRRMGYWNTLKHQDSLALEYYNKALSLPKVNPNFQSNLLDMLGETYSGMGEFQQAEQFWQKSLTLKREQFGYTNDQVSTTLLLMGDVYGKQGRYDDACLAYQGALYGLAPETDSLDIFRAFNGSPSTPKMLLSKILSGKSRALRLWYNLGNRDQRLLNTAWQHAKQAVLILDSLRFTYSDESDKQTLLSNSILIFDNAMELGFLLDSLAFSTQNPSGIYREEIFRLVEKCQARLLYESQKEFAALQVSAIPDSLLQLEASLRLDIAKLEKKYFGTTAKQATILAPKDSLLALQNAYTQLINHFEKQFPEYYKLKYDLQETSIAVVQADLPDENSALLEYFIGENRIYIFCIGKTTVEFRAVKKDFPLDELVSQLRYGLSAFHTGASGSYDSLSNLYADAAHLLYQKLLAPVEQLLPEHIILVADGALNLIPFEALLVEKPTDKISRWQLHHYWLRDHALMYAYSATMFREMRHKQHLQSPTLPFLGFAPHFEGDTLDLANFDVDLNETRSRLKPLPFSGEEVYQIHSIMGGEDFYGQEADKARFLKLAAQARCLHLATHGQANRNSGNQSYLLFSGQQESLDSAILYALDVYNMILNCDLVTLSACETGLGELRQAAGIYSLARAFAYAGAKSIVTSLWQVSDARTKDLMLEFYSRLNTNIPKDLALCQAKRQFLANNRGLNAHPYYWAGFIGFGDPAPLR